MQKEVISPNISIPHLQKRLEKLKTLAESLKNENENLPAGRLRIAQRNHWPSKLPYTNRQRQRHTKSI